MTYHKNSVIRKKKKTDKLKEKLKEHSKHHSAKHMKIMKQNMKKGFSFTKSHNIAKKL